MTRSGLAWTSGALVAASACACLLLHAGDARTPAGAGANAGAQPVAIYWNDEPATVIEPTAIGARSPLDARLPPQARDPASWRLFEARSAGNGRMRVTDAPERFRERDVMLYLAKGGWPAVGVFDRLPPDLPPAERERLDVPGAFLVQVVEIHVWTRDPPVQAGPDPGVPALRVAVEGEEGERTLTPADVAELPPVASGDRPERAGVDLLDAVDLVWPRERVAALQIEGEREVPIRWNRREDAGLVGRIALRVNNRGLWVAEVTDDGGGAVTGPAHVRGIERVVVVPGTAMATPPREAGTARAVRPPAQQPGRLERVAPLPADVEQRIRALLDLTRGGRGPEVRQSLVEALGDPAAAVRLQAVRSLAMWTDAAADLHEHLLAEETPDVQEACVDAIGRLGGAQYVDGLREWGRGRERPLRKAVDKAVRRIAKRTGVPEPDPLRER